MNAPSVGLIPALKSPGGKLFAEGLAAGGAEVTAFDSFGFVTSLADAGGGLGFDNVSDSCVTPNVAP